MFRSFATAAFLILAPVVTAAADWKVARSAHFEVYSDGSEGLLRGFVVRLERFDALMRLMTRAQPDDGTLPLRVYLLSDVRQVQRVLASDGRMLAGFYNVRDSGAFAVVPRTHRSSHEFALTPEAVLYHEYAHHLLLQYFPASYPTWYVEGFAEFFSTASFRSDGSIDLGAPALHVLPALELYGPMPLARLFAGGVRGLKQREMEQFYATAWLVTHYLTFNASRTRELEAYLAAVADGRDSVDAASAHFAGGLEAVEREVKAYLRGRKVGTMRLTPRSFPTDFEMSISVLPPDEDALMEARLQLLHRPQAAGLQDAWQVTTKVLGRFPESPAAHVVAAQILAWRNEVDSALGHLEKALASRPGYGPAHVLRAKLLLDLAYEADAAVAAPLWRDALVSITAAQRADINDPLPHYLRYDYIRRRGETVDEAAFRSAVFAFNRLPHFVDFRYALADAYAERGQFARAAEVLKPLAFAPHQREDESIALRTYKELVARAEQEAREPPAPAGSVHEPSGP